MKKFYIVDENGTYVSADRKTRFTCLTGEELFKYLNSEEKADKEFYTYFDENGDEIGIEIPVNMRKKHIREKNHSDYLKSCEKEAAYVVVSINADIDGKDGEVMTYEEVIADEDSLAFMEEISRKDDIQTLRKALASLCVDEYEIIYRLYLCENTISEREYATELGLPQKTLNNRKLAIFKKIRKFF